MDKQIFLVKGMTCGACAFTIQKQLLRLKGVKLALVNYVKEELRVDFDHKRISVQELINSVAVFGYTLKPVS